MITSTQIYWLTRFDPVKELLNCIGSCFLFFTLVLAIVAILAFCLGTFTGNRAFDMFNSRSDEELEAIHTRFRRISRWSAAFGCVALTVTVICNVLTSFIPTTREAAAIIMVPAIANSEKVQTVGNRLYELAVEWMDELRPKKEKEEAK